MHQKLNFGLNSCITLAPTCIRTYHVIKLLKLLVFLIFYHWFRISVSFFSDIHSLMPLLLSASIIKEPSLKFHFWLHSHKTHFKNKYFLKSDFKRMKKKKLSGVKIEKIEIIRYTRMQINRSSTCKEKGCSISPLRKLNDSGNGGKAGYSGDFIGSEVGVVSLRPFRLRKPFSSRNKSLLRQLQTLKDKQRRPKTFPLKSEGKIKL